MSKMTQRFLPIFLMCLLGAAPCGSDDYSQILREAISKIELGRYDEATSFIERILVRDESDMLGRTALAVVYLHTGKLDEAEREFKQVAAAGPGNWRAHYALGLISTLRKRTAEAKDHFACAAKSPDAQEELAALDLYLAFLRDGRRSPDASTPPASLLLAKQTTAMAALKSGQRERAMSLLSEILRAPASPGFEESRGPLATFDPKQPIALPGGKLTRKLAQRKDAPVVSGVVTLRADVSKAAGVHFVTLYVDDVFTGVTNCEPFQFEWDTAAHSNGLHNVRLDGKNQAGRIISSKSIWVRISNASPRKSAPMSGPEIDELVRRLWSCTRLGESRKLAHYQLAKLYLESGDTGSAIRHLEYTVAYQPSFMNARKMLNALRGRRAEYTEMKQGRPGSKMIALTFDDGPNERTAEMLDMLAKVNVPATFFVVGFRAEAQPELIKAMQAAGHQVENHTYTHANLTALTADEVEAELAKAGAVISAITGKSSAYFRPPGGHANEATRRAAARLGLTGVFWTISASPYEGSAYAGLADHVISNATDGAIVLMHNGEPAATSALPKIVGELRRQGYRFVTISEMASAGVATKQPSDGR